MQGYVVIPLLAALASAMLAAAILARDARHRTNRLAALLVSGIAFWAGCEVLWNTARDAEVALRLVRVSALGWAGLGPLSLHLLLEVTGDPAPRLRRLLPPLYAGAGAFLAVDVATPWFHPGVIRTDWGFAYRLGAIYAAFYLFTVSCILAGVGVLHRALRRSLPEGERAQARLILAGLIVPLFVASATDGLLPLAGVQLPRLGTAAFAVLGATIAWSFYRYGYPLLAPGAFGREILESLREGVALLRLDGRIRSVNGGMARLLGCTTADLEGRCLRELLPDAPLDPPAEIASLDCELLAGGERIPVSLSAAPLRDKLGYVFGLVVTVRDQREVVSLRNHLVTSGRLAAVGELAAGIAHEINNPIAFVRSNLGQLRTRWLELGERLKGSGDRQATELVVDGLEMLDESLEGVDRTAAIVRDIKGFSHGGRSGAERVELNRLLDTVLRVAAPHLRYRSTVVKHYGDVPPVPGRPQELKQVFLNLLLNASHAIGEGGTIRLSTIQVLSSVYVIIEDDGCGIPREVIDRIFDPFFTTKRVGEGTGLGLSISYQIVRRHGGEITVESEPGRGTVFRVRLPTAPPEEVDASAPRAAAPPRAPGVR